MEQFFAAFGVNVKLLLAQTVNFGVLLIALTYFFYKPLMRSLAERQKVITKGVDDAERATQKLEAADSISAKHISEAENQAEDIMSKARESASTERTILIRDAEKRAKSVADAAEARAVEDAARILRDSEKEIARLAILAAEKTMQKS